MLTKEEQKYVDDKRDTFYDDRIGFQFFYLLHQFGFLKLINSKPYEEALLTGRTQIVPYNVHHIRPLGLFGNNDFLNLSLMDERMHDFVHEYCIPKKLLKRLDGKKGEEKEKLINYFLPTFAPIAKKEDYLRECIVCAIRSSVYCASIKKLKDGKYPLTVLDLKKSLSGKALRSIGFSSRDFYRLIRLHANYRLAPKGVEKEIMKAKIQDAEKKFIGRTEEKEFFLEQMRRRWIQLNTLANEAEHFTAFVLIQQGAQPKSVLTEKGQKKALLYIMSKKRSDNYQNSGS